MSRKAIQKWWHPEAHTAEKGLNWSCDTINECEGTMNAMWQHICKLDPSLPRDGWDNENME